MRNIIAFILMSLLLGFNTQAQKNTVFKEDFETYDNDWKLINTKEFVVKQDDGKLFMSKATQNRVVNGCLWYKKTINGFDASKDFSIKFDANAISSEFDTESFDIQWGKIYEADGVRITSVYQLYFGINKIRLGKFELNNGGWTYYTWSDQLYDSELSKFVAERNTFHNYEITQESKMLMVKVDGKLVYKIPIVPKVGSEIGFQRCLKGELLLDNLIIKQ